MPSTSPTASENGLGQGLDWPRIKGAASARCRAPPNTISAFAIKSRAPALKPETPSSPMPTMDSQRWSGAGSGMIGSGRAMKILILGGTAESRALAGALAKRPDRAVTLSLAGRTANPSQQGVPTRSGGFGGAEGLAAYLRLSLIHISEPTRP